MAPEPPSPAAGLGRRQVLAGVWAGGLAGAAAWLTPRDRGHGFAEAPLTLLTPPRIGPWRAVDGIADVVPQTLEDEAASDRTLLSSFVAENLPRVMTAASYHSAASRDVKVHRPEVCYENGGFALSGRRPLDLRLSDAVVVPAQSFTATRGSRVEQVLYWTRLEADFPRDLVEQRLAMIRYGLEGVAADGLLMRFSSTGPEAPRRLDVLTGFARLLFASANPTARRMMVGALAASAG